MNSASLMEVLCCSGLADGSNYLIQMWEDSGDGMHRVGGWHLLGLVLLWGLCQRVGLSLPRQPEGYHLYTFCWWLCQWGWLVSAGLPWQLTSFLPLVVDSLWWSDCAAMTLLAHHSQPIVYFPQMVDDCALILAYLAAPGEVGHSVEMA